jgi:hypothetical protein
MIGMLGAGGKVVGTKVGRAMVWPERVLMAHIHGNGLQIAYHHIQGVLKPRALAHRLGSPRAACGIPQRSGTGRAKKVSDGSQNTDGSVHEMPQTHTGSSPNDRSVVSEEYVSLRIDMPTFSGNDWRITSTK